MLLIDYIEERYGEKRGNKANFLRDNQSILPQELSRWINIGLKVNLDTGEIYKPTSKSIDVTKGLVSKSDVFSDKTNAKLQACAEKVNMPYDEFINYLLDDEIERNQRLSLSQDVEKNQSNTPVQVIAEIVNRHFSTLSHASEIYQYHHVLENLTNELIKKKLLSLKVPENCIAESERLKIPRVAYYWYGGVIADRIAKILGTYEVYLWREYFASESEVIFIGAPNNVVSCYLICEKICKLLKKTKSAYKKANSQWGSKREIEDEANSYVCKFAQGAMESENYIYDDDSQMRIIDYAVKNYSYAMD